MQTKGEGSVNICVSTVGMNGNLKVNLLSYGMIGRKCNFFRGEYLE